MPIERILLMMAIVSILSTGALPAAAAGETPVSSSRQAIVVKTASWETYQGVLQCYERTSGDATWRRAGGEIPVVVGRYGLGWGLGLHPAGKETAPAVQPDKRRQSTGCAPADEIKSPTVPKEDQEKQTGIAIIPEDESIRGQADLPPSYKTGPDKKEGDGRAPAGIFRLGNAFGYEPRHECSWIRMPYLEATRSLKCIDDVRSRYYNRLVTTGTGESSDWSSCEDMRRRDDQYRLGIVVEHNTDPVVPGRGSCIFLHIWQGPDKGTAGCTALAPENLEKIMRWLDPSAAPVFIQLPNAAYRELQAVWKLP